MTSLHIDVNLQDENLSTITFGFTKFSPTFEVLDTASVILTAGETKQIVPNVGDAIRIVADAINPFIPA
jgi:hypothetical protein